jgi:hypothetical protein
LLGLLDNQLKKIKVANFTEKDIRTLLLKMIAGKCQEETSGMLLSG